MMVASRIFKAKGAGNRGYSLVEIISVLLLLGIMAAFAVPKFFNADSSFSLERASALIRSDIRYVQHLAMTRADNKKAVFTLGGTSYELRSSDDSVLKTVDLPSGVTVSSADISYTFNSLGEPVAGGGGAVTIAGGGGAQRTITVASYTGRVTIS